MNSPTPSQSGRDGSLEDMFSNLLLSDPEIDSVTWRKESLTESVTITRQARCSQTLSSASSPRSVSLSRPQPATLPRSKDTQATPSQAQQRSSNERLPARQSKSQGQPTNNAFVLPPPNPSEIKLPSGNEAAEGFYVVTVGQEVGIFFSWLDASERVTNVLAAQHKRYRTFKDALQAYTCKYNEGAVRVTPLVGSRFWPSQPTSNPTPPSTPSRSSSDEFWAYVDDISEVATRLPY